MLASKIPFFIYDNADMFTNVVLTDQSFHLYLRYSAFSLRWLWENKEILKTSISSTNMYKKIIHVLNIYAVTNFK